MVHLVFLALVVVFAHPSAELLLGALAPTFVAILAFKLR